MNCNQIVYTGIKNELVYTSLLEELYLLPEVDNWKDGGLGGAVGISKYGKIIVYINYNPFDESNYTISSNKFCNYALSELPCNNSEHKTVAEAMKLVEVQIKSYNRKIKISNLLKEI